MFDLLDRPLHWITVKWAALLPPEEEGGLSVPGHHEVELRVELLDRTEFAWRFAIIPEDFEDEIPPQCADPDDPTKWGPAPSTLDSFLRIVKDWRKISAAGKTVELNEANARILLASPGFVSGFGETYTRAMGGIAEIREKNSDGSPTDGRATAEPKTNGRSKKTASDSD